jgi:hypothetical protein
VGAKESNYLQHALLANTLWRVITHDSIWHRIILDKYLGNRPVIAWICRSSQLHQKASSIWSGLTSTFFVILHWLRWRPGSGNLISLGRDKLIGLEDRSILSEPLLSHLHSLNIRWLAQARIPSSDCPFPDRWITCEMLGITRATASEWELFVSSLKCVGIYLSEDSDSIMWMGGDASGIISVKNLYTTLLQPFEFSSDNDWIYKLWKWTVQLKVKLFIWLAAKEKVLTWEALQKKGWFGPRVCKLCNCS